jgi:hypothetical protein
MKFYFPHIISSEVGTTLKHPKTINGNIKNLSKIIEKKNKRFLDEKISYFCFALKGC